MVLIEVGNNKYCSLCEGGVVQWNCQSPFHGALDFDPLYMDIA